MHHADISVPVQGVSNAISPCLKTFFVINRYLLILVKIGCISELVVRFAFHLLTALRVSMASKSEKTTYTIYGQSKSLNQFNLRPV